MYRRELGHDYTRPVLEDLYDRNIVGHAEREVQVGPAVALRLRERSDDCAGNDPRVVFCQLQHAVTKPIALLDGEHGGSS